MTFNYKSKVERFDFIHKELIEKNKKHILELGPSRIFCIEIFVTIKK